MEKSTNQFETFLGIDISKKTLDYCILDRVTAKPIFQGKTTNDRRGILVIIKQLKSFNKTVNTTLFCYEDTGIYTMPLNLTLSEHTVSFWVVPAIEMKRSTGISRGKSDTVDARKIAFYALTHVYKFQQYALPEKDLQELKLLQTERQKIVDCIKQMKRTKEITEFYSKETTKITLKINEKCVKELMTAQKAIEKRIAELMAENEAIQKQMNLITSIHGVGNKTALYLILATNGFTKFKEWRQMACYAGVAPFEYSSGTSVKGRNKVHPLADKRLKSLLHMCALGSIKHDKGIKEYYIRKKNEGKHSMLVLNNVRSKILARIFAVVKRETLYVDMQKWAA